MAGTTAWAGPALDEATPPSTEEPASTDAATAPATTSTSAPDADNLVSYGVGLRLRNMWIPTGLIELFVERSAGGTSNVGFGVEAIRRRGTVELQLAFEFEHVTPGEGVWIKKGDDVASGDQTDYILSPDHAPGGASLGWFTIEFTFLNHTPFNKHVALRYGGGLGIGIITGDLFHHDVVCQPGATNEQVSPGCVPTARGGTATNVSVPLEYDLPPVFPVVNAIIGLQVTPMPKLAINVETGIRTFPFLGISSSYLF